MSEAIPTLNNCGYQMGTPSPLLQDWLTSYDGEHPLLDVGCAYGINTFKALEKGIPTIALDPEEKHLQILQEKLDKNFLHLISVVVGSVPNKFNFPNLQFSGILCSEILHFLDGNDMESSLRIFEKALVPGGKLVLTMLSDKYLQKVDEEKYCKFHQDLKAGLKWPGVITVDDDYLLKSLKVLQSPIAKTELRRIMPSVFQVCTIKQLTDELENIGFKILQTHLSEHHGHPDQEGFAKWPDHTLMIVAEKGKKND